MPRHLQLALGEQSVLCPRQTDLHAASAAGSRPSYCRSHVRIEQITAQRFFDDGEGASLHRVNGGGNVRVAGVDIDRQVGSSLFEPVLHFAPTDCSFRGRGSQGSVMSAGGAVETGSPVRHPAEDGAEQRARVLLRIENGYVTGKC